MSTAPSSVRSLQEIWATAEISNSVAPAEFGIKAIDDALNGGLFWGKVYEIYGDHGSGKTQMALTLVAQKLITIHVNKGDELIFYLHTAGTFPIDRLRQIIEAKLKIQENCSYIDSETTKAILKQLRISSVFDPQELIKKLANICNSMEDPSKIRLLVLDSIAALFRAFFKQKGPTGNYLPNLYHSASLLKRMAFQLNMAVLVVNDTSTGLEPGALGVTPAVTTGKIMSLASGTKIKPALGEVWSNCINGRIALFCMKTMFATKRFMHVEFCPHASTSDLIPIAIKEHGVETVRSEVATVRT